MALSFQFTDFLLERGELLLVQIEMSLEQAQLMIERGDGDGRRGRRTVPLLFFNIEAANIAERITV